MKNKIIAVIGATGSQGKGVVNALIKEVTFKVRAISRNPANYSGDAHEVLKADLTKVRTLKEAFKGAHGVFVVTNFWEGANEIVQGKAAIQAAKEAGVQHFIWSTLPDVEKISNGKFDVPQFTCKAKVDALVKAAGFEYYTFVQPPFYFQNLTGQMGAQLQVYLMMKMTHGLSALISFRKYPDSIKPALSQCVINVESGFELKNMWMDGAIMQAVIPIIFNLK